jgi:hypothetical protein
MAKKKVAELLVDVLAEAGVQRMYGAVLSGAATKSSIWQKSISYGNSPTTKGQFNATTQNRCDQGPQ